MLFERKRSWHQQVLWFLIELYALAQISLTVTSYPLQRVEGLGSGGGGWVSVCIYVCVVCVHACVYVCTTQVSGGRNWKQNKTKTNCNKTYNENWNCRFWVLKKAALVPIKMYDIAITHTHILTHAIATSGTKGVWIDCVMKGSTPFLASKLRSTLPQPFWERGAR